MQKRAFVTALCLLVCALATAQTTRFVVAGDSRGNGDPSGINGTILTELVAAIIAEGAEFVLFPGDLTDIGSLSQMQNWMAAFFDPLEAAGIPVYSSRGNHDGNLTAWNTVFSGEHALPDNGPPGEVNLTYSFTYNNALFIALEENIDNPSGQVNQAWLDEQLANNTRPHVFVFGHYPAFAVYHSSCLARYPGPRDVFWNSLALAGARVYFTGHDHFYNHARIQDAWGGCLHQYVVGTAGAPLYDWSGSYADPDVYGIAHYKNYGYVVVDINGFDVRITFKQRSGPNDYVATSDVFTYLGSFRGEGVPATAVAGLIVAGTSILAVFGFRRYARALESNSSSRT